MEKKVKILNSWFTQVYQNQILVIQKKNHLQLVGWLYDSATTRHAIESRWWVDNKKERNYLKDFKIGIG